MTNVNFTICPDGFGNDDVYSFNELPNCDRNLLADRIMLSLIALISLFTAIGMIDFERKRLNAVKLLPVDRPRSSKESKFLKWVSTRLAVGWSLTTIYGCVVILAEVEHTVYTDIFGCVWFFYAQTLCFVALCLYLPVLQAEGSFATKQGSESSNNSKGESSDSGDMTYISRPRLTLNILARMFITFILFLLLVTASEPNGRKQVMLVLLTQCALDCSFNMVLFTYSITKLIEMVSDITGFDSVVDESSLRIEPYGYSSRLRRFHKRLKTLRYVMVIMVFSGLLSLAIIAANRSQRYTYVVFDVFHLLQTVLLLTSRNLMKKSK